MVGFHLVPDEDVERLRRSRATDAEQQPGGGDAGNGQEFAPVHHVLTAHSLSL